MLHRLIGRHRGVARLDTPSKPRQIDLVTTVLVFRLKTNERDDELEVVPDAVLQFFKEDILVANLTGIFLALRALSIGYIDKRGYAVVFSTVLIFNKPGYASTTTTFGSSLRNVPRNSSPQRRIA